MNKGIAPLDPNTEVGKFRLMVGDTSFEQLCPEQPGFGDYEMFSDAEIEMFLGQGESLEAAASFAYFQLAGQAAIEAKSVRDFDLQISTEKRAEYLLRMAQMWADRATALTADIFEVFDISGGRCRMELAEGVSCGRRCGCFI